MKKVYRWLIVPPLGALGVLGLTAALVRPDRTQAGVVKAAPPAAPLTLLWSRPVAGFRGAALSPQGELIALASGRKGSVSLWHWRTQPLQPLWVHAAANASEVAVSASGSFVATWSPLDPAQPDFTLLRGADGATLSHRTLDGAVWDAQLSADGCYAGVVTGGRTLYHYVLSEQPYKDHDKRIQKWPLDGIGTSVDFTTAHSYLVTGTWDSSGVSCYTPRGVRLWAYPENAVSQQKMADKLFTAQISGDGRYILGVSSGNIREGDPTLFLWRSDGGGSPQWQSALGADAFFPRAQISRDGHLVAVSYLRQLVRGGQTLSEHRLRLLDSDGNSLWERGGLLFSPTLVALGPTGSVLVSDGQRTLYSLSREGRIGQSCSLPGRMRDTKLSADGRMLLVYTGDGTLSLYKLSSGP